MANTQLTFRGLGFLLLALIVTPLQLLIWRAIWGFLMMYVITDDPHPPGGGLLKLSDASSKVTNAGIVFVVGLTLRFVIEISQHELGDVLEQFEERYHGRLAKMATVPFTYAYIMLNIFVSICFWCGLFALLDDLKDQLSPPDVSSASNKGQRGAAVLAVMTVASLCVLLLLRASISMVSGPLAVASDKLTTVFSAATLYDARLTNSSYKAYATDQILSLVVHLTVVCGWWSIWGLIDVAAASIVKPTSLNGGYHWSDICIGTGLVTIAYLTQYPLKRITRFRDVTNSYHVCHYVIVLTATLGSILSWRGWWQVFDKAMPHLISGSGQQEEWLITSGIGAIVLVLLGCLNTAAVRGVGIRVEHYEDELLFDLEYQHLWAETSCCCCSDRERPLPVAVSSSTTSNVVIAETATLLANEEEGQSLLSANQDEEDGLITDRENNFVDRESNPRRHRTNLLTSS